MGRQCVIPDPAVMMGKPVITGTRITVELILEKLEAGETVSQILDAHPRLTPKPSERPWLSRRKSCELMCSTHC